MKGDIPMAQKPLKNTDTTFEKTNQPERSPRQNNRGRRADKPSGIPKQGWRDILLRVKEEQNKDNISIIAAGVAFYSLLAIIPALAAMISIYGLVFDPAGIQQQLSFLQNILPADAYQLLQSQLNRLVSSSGGALGLGLIVGLLLSIWSAAKGMKALMIALNIAYDEAESRSFIKINGLALLLTFGGILFMLLSLALIAALPAIFGTLGLPESIQTALSISKWPVLAILIMVAVSILYRYAPDRDRPRFRWISWGATGATLLWIAASLLFSFYVSNFGSYNKTYGSMGAIIILLMWFYLTAYAVLMGAELNAEMEHQTQKDTTRGKPDPMGQRGAHAADTVGRVPE